MNPHNTPFFPEPQVDDPTPAFRGESTWDWLSRSTWSRAVDSRRFLNEHIARIPTQNQTRLVHDLQSRWKSAFFELVVIRLAQELGASVLIEQSNVDGKRPDITANFPDGSVVIEANSPVIDGEMGKTVRERIPLLNYIESKIPNDWSVGVFELPDISENESKKEFKVAVDELFSRVNGLDPEIPSELVAVISQGRIRIHLWPSKSKQTRLATEGVLSTMDSTHERISKVVAKKRRQVRNSEAPVLLAVEASGISSDFEDFERALFGTTFERYDINRQLVETGFAFDGAFSKYWNTEKSPTYAGVLAFLGVGFSGMGFNGRSAPVLFKHPRFTGRLPAALSQLEQRSFDVESKQIVVTPAKNSDLLSFFNFAKV